MFDKKIRLLNITAVIGCFLFIISAVFLLSFNVSLAQEPDIGLDYAANLELANSDQDPRDLIVTIVRYLMAFVGLVAVIIIMYAGWLWMTSNGAPDKIDKAKKTLVNGVIGLIIIIISYAIVMFIINLFTSGLPGSGDSNRPPFGGGGIGALGNCTIESVYPEPGQSEVPRNTIMIITFREAIAPNTIHDAANRLISDGRVRIYRSDSDPEIPSNWITNVAVAMSADNKTVVLIPDDYLGSPSEYIWYSVYLSNSIEKFSGGNVFDNCYHDHFRWDFEVSNRVDLTPPYVIEGDIFPPADNLQDTVVGSSPVQAQGTITVNSQPAVHQDASFTPPVNPQPGSPAATIALDSTCGETGILSVTVAPDGISAQLNNGAILLGGAVFAGDTVTFPNYLSLTITSGVITAGNSWNIIGVSPEVDADTLRVGSQIYIFGDDIASNADNTITASNIAAALTGHPQVFALAVGNVVTVTARDAGTHGNNIVLESTILDIIPMSGGAESDVDITVNDRRDKARNAVIQINFNEAINPLTVSGDAADIENYVRVVNNNIGAQPAGGACVRDSDCVSFNCDEDVTGLCQGTNFYLPGTWFISNRYRTVEFISDNLCGVNGCGEEIYCLPGMSNLRVELIAATLADCGTDMCASRSPFNTCGGSAHCENSAGEFYPLSSIALMNGVMDAALNSLDADRSGDAEGPGAFYNENLDSGAGDDYQWSFFINDDIELDPPVIDDVNPLHGTLDISLVDPVYISFSDIMMSNSLRTGWIIIFNGREDVEHKLMNLWSLSTRAVGYWISKENIDGSMPLDGEMDYTRGEIRHGIFPDATSFRAQIGSGVKDIYQNCFKPSAGPGCAAVDTAPSCCMGGIAPTGVLGGDGNCP